MSVEAPVVAWEALLRDICGGSEKKHKISAGWDLNLRTPEYEGGAVAIRLLHSFCHLETQDSKLSPSNVTRHRVVTCRAKHRQAKHVSLRQLLCSIFEDLDDCSLYYICVFTQTARRSCSTEMEFGCEITSGKGWIMPVSLHFVCNLIV